MPCNLWLIPKGFILTLSPYSVHQWKCTCKLIGGLCNKILVLADRGTAPTRVWGIQWKYCKEINSNVFKYVSNLAIIVQTVVYIECNCLKPNVCILKLFKCVGKLIKCFPMTCPFWAILIYKVSQDSLGIIFPEEITFSKWNNGTFGGHQWAFLAALAALYLALVSGGWVSAT